MEITRASTLDLEALQRFDEICFPNDAWNVLTLFVILLRPGRVRLKAIEDGRIVGFAVGRKARSDGVAWIQSIAVLPEFRRRGLARKLLRACEARLDAPRVRLYVRASNAAAIHLYAGEGYARVDLQEGFYRDGEAAVVMERVGPRESGPGSP